MLDRDVKICFWPNLLTKNWNSFLGIILNRPTSNKKHCGMRQNSPIFCPIFKLWSEISPPPCLAPKSLDTYQVLFLVVFCQLTPRNGFCQELFDWSCAQNFFKKPFQLLGGWFGNLFAFHNLCCSGLVMHVCAHFDDQKVDRQVDFGSLHILLLDIHRSPILPWILHSDS